ncbi:MAG: TetR/AcrR family transcriptional regulator [Deltaproteobacteria bacterium]|nr:TetR/AcrR family transcriptional regulator [Kofleriaceae bacterium]
MLDASRHEFAAHGYAGASLDDIARRAAVTKGALYHHFINKAALLEAVYVELELEVAAKVKAAIDAAGDHAMTRVAAAFEAFFDASADPTYQRIVLRDAPGVLGRTKGRGLDHAIGLDLVIALIEDLRRDGFIGADVPVTMAARIFLAAVSEVAMAAAHSDDPAATRRDGTFVLLTIIDGVRLAAAARRP